MSDKALVDKSWAGSWSTSLLNFSRSSCKSKAQLQSSASQGSLYEHRGKNIGPTVDEVQKRWKENRTGLRNVLSPVGSENETSLSWSGLLLKRSRGPIGSWKPRSFEIVPPPPSENDNTGAGRLKCAVIIYHSEVKGEQHLYVGDVRRESHLDSGIHVAFSIGLTTPPNPASNDQAQPERKRMHLMAATDLEAVAFLSCLRRILQPERTWPTVRHAIHFPAKILSELE
jgi:hypothetical protein